MIQAKIKLILVNLSNYHKDIMGYNLNHLLNQEKKFFNSNLLKKIPKDKILFNQTIKN